MLQYSLSLNVCALNRAFSTDVCMWTRDQRRFRRVIFAIAVGSSKSNVSCLTPGDTSLVSMAEAASPDGSLPRTPSGQRWRVFTVLRQLGSTIFLRCS